IKVREKVRSVRTKDVKSRFADIGSSSRSLIISSIRKYRLKGRVGVRSAIRSQPGVRQRTPASFPSTLQTEITPSPSTLSSESESSSTSRPRPARINYAFHPQQEPYGNVNPEWRISHSQQAKFPTQLIRVLNTLSN